MKNKIILFDIDHTLFDTAAFVEKVYDENKNAISKKEFYDFLGQIKGNLSEVSNEDPVKSKILKDLWEKASLIENLYSETIPALKMLCEKFVLGIFSKGDKKFQLSKIMHIKHFFEDKNIHIAPDKNVIIAELVEAYRDYDIALVDDILKVLFEVKKVENRVFTIMIKREAYYESYLSNQKPIERFNPDATINSLSEIANLFGDESGLQL